MGAGLFLMAEMLDIPIVTMMLVALVPALLFFISVLFSVHFESKREGLGAVPAGEIPAFRQFTAIGVWAPLLVPFVCLLSLIIIGYSVGYSALIAITALVAIRLLKCRGLGDLRATGRMFLKTLDDMAEPLVTLAVMVAVAGLLVGVINIVSIGTKFSELVLAVGQGSQFLSLILAGGLVILIGMGMPTTAAYVLAASVITFALQNVGLSELQAHMFVFYFATLSAITPPVCTAVFVAAGIADAPWLSVAGQTIRIAVVKYLLPFAFVLQPALLLEGTTGEAAIAMVSAVAGAILLSAGFAGYLVTTLTRVERVCIGILGAVTMLSGWAVGLVAVATVAAIQLLRLRKHAPFAVLPSTDAKERQ